MSLHSYLNKSILMDVHNGNQILGTVTKVNPKCFKVKVTQGDSKYLMGATWNVPHTLAKNLDGTYIVERSTFQKTLDAVKDGIKVPISDFWLKEHEKELEILGEIYSGLSPENLTGDGEVPRYRVQQRYQELSRKLKACFVLLDRELDEGECYDCLERLKGLEDKSAFDCLKSGS